jgi:acetate kinase
LKFQVFATPTLAVRLRGQVEGIGTRPHFVARSADGVVLADNDLDAQRVGTPAACLDFLSAWLPAALDDATIVGVGHRVVHGGPRYKSPVSVDDAVLAILESFTPLAPLHQPHNLAPIRTLLKTQPDLPQVACFDTSFHRTQPQVADMFALPMRYYEAGIRRYGFHGLSYEYIVSRLPELAPELQYGRVVIAHLGSGASACAVQNGQSVASTMGFTALDGLPMGTRCGSIDPGVIFHLLREHKMDVDSVEDLLYRRAGLLGISGVSNDLRELLANPDPAARLAVEYFVYRIAREIGSLVAAVGGVDGIVFTAGIGENSAAVRAQVCEQIRWLGITLDPVANAAGASRITLPESRVSAWVVPTNEERVIAEHSYALIIG